MRAVSEDAPVSEPGPSTAPGGDELLASGPKKDRKRSSIAILKRAHTVNLDDLKPDHDGDGKVSAFEKEVWKRLQAVDKDGSKAITLAEFLGTFGGAPGAAGDGKTAAMLMLTNEMATAEEATPAVTPEAAIAAFGMRLGSLGKVPPTVKADSMADAMGVEAVSAVSAPAEEGI